ncbi:hypothetical protein JTE90_014553 [Oedothorax gibbosus]|uniref:Uncharacterized protein n=1 Tax=Oedothorax gibbosus TaxID=931172 RepID=A0AAV6UEH8_9ARAC|nr:hypothetical protein JTE90_014553 [Oedothorax gibbosus]
MDLFRTCKSLPNLVPNQPIWEPPQKHKPALEEPSSCLRMTFPSDRIASQPRCRLTGQRPMIVCQQECEKTFFVASLFVKEVRDHKK